jgi:RNA-directed DNA polymerase
LEALRERLAQFGLELHPEKTRLIEFGRNAAQNREGCGERKPETFDFLGFTHICGKNGKTGCFVVNRKTVKKRMRAKLQALKEELRQRMHEPIVETGKWLKTVVRGYYQYHAIPGNTGSLSIFRERLTRLWRQNIRRRSQQRQPNWKQLHPLFIRWLPVPRILHPFPNVRFDAIHPR